MDTAKHVQILQMAYAGALADTVLQFSKEGVLETCYRKEAPGATGHRPNNG